MRNAILYSTHVAYLSTYHFYILDLYDVVYQIEAPRETNPNMALQKMDNQLHFFPYIYIY